MDLDHSIAEQVDSPSSFFPRQLSRSMKNSILLSGGCC